MKTILHGLLTDNQGGGYTVELFPTPSDRLATQIERHGADKDFEGDEYECGYRSEVELDFDDDGVLRKSATMGFGQ